MAEQPDLEVRGRARATVTRRLSTIAGFTRRLAAVAARRRVMIVVSYRLRAQPEREPLWIASPLEWPSAGCPLKE